MSSPTPAPASTETFAQKISNNDALQLIGVIANCSGIISSALGIYSFFEGLEQPDNATLLNAINQLAQTLQNDFNQLGELIQEQTQIIVDTVNRDGMALALSSSDVAAARIQAFLSDNDPAALETAISESIAGVSFFAELNLSSPADLLYFLPGLVKAGAIRIFVIFSEPPASREPTSVVVANINSMVTLLSAMIDSVIATTNAAHTVGVKSHTTRCSVIPEVVQGRSAPAGLGSPVRTVTVIDGYTHDEHGVVLQFFDAQQGNPPCEQPSGHEKAALAAAQQARSQGVSDELAFIGIPAFQQILQSWTELFALATVIDLNGIWESGGTPGPVVSVNGNLISVDMSAYKRPTASGTIIDDSDISVDFPDDKTYTGKLQAPKTILWSNNSAWTKV